jgi:hypothetical protein
MVGIMADGLAREGFDLDLKFGEARETAFVHALTDCTVESKSDQKLRITGNVFVETHQKPRSGEWRTSGINTSHATWYAIEYDDDAWIVIRRRLLWQVALRAPARFGGDENRFRGRLVPVGWLITPWTPVPDTAA